MSEFLHLMQDPAHWGFEVVSDVVLGLVIWLPARWAFERWHKRHDREKHGDGG